MLLLLALLAACPIQSSTTDGLRVMRLDQALFKIEGISSDAVVVGDANGDGAVDLVASSFGKQGKHTTIDLYCGRTGKRLRTLWTAKDKGRLRLGSAPWDDGELRAWHAGCDLDGDGIGDLLFTSPLAAISVGTGKALPMPEGVESDKNWISLAPLSDIDGDGYDDYALGVTPRKPGHRLVTITADEGFKTVQYFETVQYPGYVSARSGKDASELWRVDSPNSQPRFGMGVHGAGDVDGDGCQDVVATTPGFRTPGSTLLLSGRTGALLSTIHGRRNAHPAGDVDGDGRGDLFLGDPFSGYVLASTRELDDLEVLALIEHRSMFACTPSAIGDLDGDGLAEFITDDLPPSSEVHRSSGVLCSGETRKPLVKFSIKGHEQATASSALPLSDLNGDGRPEFLVMTGSGGAYAFSLSENSAPPVTSDKR